MIAARLLTQNLRSLIQRRGCSAADVAFSCRRSKPWMSRLMSDSHKKIAFRDLDRLAAYFDCHVMELFRDEPKRSTGAPAYRRRPTNGSSSDGDSDLRMR